MSDKKMNQNNNAQSQRIIGRLRSRFRLSEDECSDDELMRATAGTLGRASVEMRIAIDGLRESLRAALQPWLR